MDLKPCFILMSKMHENVASCESLVNGFHKCCLWPFNPDAVYEKLLCQNAMSPRKALDESLLQQMENMTESPLPEKAVSKQNETERLDLKQGKPISNLEGPKSNCDDSKTDSEDSTSSSSDGSSTDEDLMS